ncbi:MAG: alpha/beta hydrolase [Ectothiorhodospiraceae bacterium]|nr:alpha/beta hydrolase [Ectothiorhodospiraceae bacterium]
MTRSDGDMTHHLDEPRIAFASLGDSGPPVLFLPGSYSTERAWRRVWAHLPGGWRLAATSLCGCGATVETRSPGDSSMDHELAVVAEAVRRLSGGPVHLVGHSFGGMVALAAALSERIPVASLALFEANPVGLIAGNAALYDEVRALATAFSEALDRGEPDAAAYIIDWWSGAGTFAAMPEEVQEFCRTVAPANRLDWEIGLGFHPDHAAISALGIPVLLVRGERAVPAMVAMTDVLSALLPSAQCAVVADAGHFLISTHPAACAGLLTDHLEHAEGAAQSRTRVQGESHRVRRLKRPS